MGTRGEGMARGAESLPDWLPLNEKNILVRVR